MKSEGVRNEKVGLLGTEPVSATRGSGDLRVSMFPGADGLLSVVAISGETSRDGGKNGPDTDRVRAVLEVTARWWGGGVRGGETIVACKVDSGLWWVAVLRSDASKEAQWILGDWMLPKFPGAAAGSDGALVGLFGEAARYAVCQIED